MIDCHSVFHENCCWLLKQYNMSGRGVVCEYPHWCGLATGTSELYCSPNTDTQEYCLSSEYERSEQLKLLSFSFEVKWDFCRFPLNIIDHDKCVKCTASTSCESVSCANIQHIHYIITSQTWLLSFSILPLLWDISTDTQTSQVSQKPGQSRIFS